MDMLLAQWLKGFNVDKEAGIEESFTVKKYVQNELNLPFIQIETDYSDSDTGQIKTRVGAFLETIEISSALI